MTWNRSVPVRTTGTDFRPSSQALASAPSGLLPNRDERLGWRMHAWRTQNFSQGIPRKAWLVLGALWAVGQAWWVWPDG